MYVYVLCTVQTALRYLRVLLSEITEYKLLIFPKNIDTSAVMRVVIKDFNMTASEVERLWAEQDNYIDLLESQLRQSEEKGRKKWSQREQMLTKEVIRKKQEVHELKALVAELKSALARSPDELRQTLEKVCLDHNYNKPVEETGPEKSDGKETESQAVHRIKNSKSTQTVLMSQSSQSTQTVLKSQSTLSTQTEDSVKSSRIYSEADIKKGSLLMFISPKAYRFLRKVEPRRYPDPSTVRRHIQGFRCYYGMNDEMFFVLRQKFASVMKDDRNVMMVFDEIDIQWKELYSAHFKERVPAAKKVMVVMVRGLRSGFKEIIYYNFDTVMKKETGKSAMDRQLLCMLIEQVERAGGFVRGITLDMGNKTLLSQLKVFDGSSSFPHPTRKDKKIYVFPDVPHLIKLLRNHILREGVTFQFEGKSCTLRKSDFEKLLDQDAPLGELRRLYKLKRIHLDCHGHQLQCVRTAVQLLSQSVANSFKLGERRDLAYFVSVVNAWFDVMDSRTKYHRYNEIKSGLGVNWEEQENSLNKMYELVSQMVIGRTEKMKGERKEMVAFQKGILCSIKSVRSLFEELREEGFSYLLTHKLNQDILENLFSAIRGMGGSDTNPDPVTFCNRIRILKLQQDYDPIKLLIEGKKTSVELSVDEILEEPFIAQELVSEADVDLNNFDEGAQEYVAGYITRELGLPSVEPTGWTGLQSHGGLKGASEKTLAEVKMMDRAFNVVHGVGAKLNNEMKVDPIQTTVVEISKRCPEITLKVIQLFTKVKYHKRIKDINEQNLRDQKTERKRKAAEKNELPKRQKGMRDYTKAGHFASS